MKKLNDLLGYKNRKIYQDDKYFSFCLDSVLLANFIDIKKKDTNLLVNIMNLGIILSSIFGVLIISKLSLYTVSIILILFTLS